MSKELKTAVYTRRCIDKYNKKLREENPEIFKEKLEKRKEYQNNKIKSMKENEPEKYQAYLIKVRLYLKSRRDKQRELKKQEKISDE